MTNRHRAFVYCAVSTGAVFLAGCASSHPQQFAHSFLPSAPAPMAFDGGEPPRIPSPPYTNELPRVLPPPSARSEADVRIRKSEERFEAGKRLYQEGDANGARLEFDAALTVLLTAPVSLVDHQKIEQKLEQLADNIYKYDLDGLAEGSARSEVVFEKAPLDDMLQMTFPTDPRLAPKVSLELHGTASELPLDSNDAVLSYIHYFSTDRGRRTLIAGLRRSGRYRDLISRVLTEEGVPQELMYLAQAESGFVPYAMSNKSATGMWQFVQWRGREYGLNQTAWSDDRLDPEKATRAAAHHLKDLYNELGDWYLAMAAYNCGPVCVEKAVERTGFADFWELRSRNALPHETQNYVPLILAMTIMAKNPHDYGLDGLDVDRPLEYDTVAVDAATNLWLVADIADRPLSEIRELNPALLRPVAPAGYPLHVPKGAAAGIATTLTQFPADRRASWRMHRVAEGETLALIAKSFHAPVAAIAAVNNISVEAPATGDLLMIPVSASPDRSLASRAAGRLPRHRGSRRGVATARNVPSRILDRRASASRARLAGARRNRG
jgi:membrane-bound lytic murein transglycosylase D